MIHRHYLDFIHELKLLRLAMALKRVVRQRVLERDYAQFAKNDISYFLNMLNVSEIQSRQEFERELVE